MPFRMRPSQRWICPGVNLSPLDSVPLPGRVDCHRTRCFQSSQPLAMALLPEQATIRTHSLGPSPYRYGQEAPSVRELAFPIRLQESLPIVRPLQVYRRQSFRRFPPRCFTIARLLKRLFSQRSAPLTAVSSATAPTLQRLIWVGPLQGSLRHSWPVQAR